MATYSEWLKPIFFRTMWKAVFINETLTQNASFATRLTFGQINGQKLNTCLYFRWLNEALNASFAFIFWLLIWGHDFSLSTSLSLDHVVDIRSIKLYDAIVEDVRA